MSPDLIIDTVCEYYCQSRAKVSGPSRRSDIAFMRHAAIYLCCELTSMRFNAIATYFSNRNHSTLIHARERMAALVKDDPKVCSQLVDIQGIIERKHHARCSINYGRGIQQEPGSADAATSEEVLAGAKVGEGESGSIKRWRACRLHNRGSFFVSRLRHDYPKLV
jgi:hypothetical protein